MQIDSANLNGVEKAAILFIALGPDRSSAIMKCLPEKLIEEITFEISNITHIDSVVKNDVLDEFIETQKASDYIKEGGIDYAKEILTRALGVSRAEEIIVNSERLSNTRKPFAFVRKTDPFQLLKTILNEHPQTIALVLCFLEPDKASMILQEIPDDMKADIAYRIATMNKTSPKVIKQVEEILERKLSSATEGGFESYGGVDTIVNILNSVTKGVDKDVLGALDQRDKELADEIRNSMFVFEDIVNLDSASVQRVLSSIDNSDLCIALKGASTAVSDLIFGNISKRAGESLKEDIEFLGPVRLTAVEEAQHKILAVIRKLDEAGEIFISRGDSDAVIV